MSAWSTCARRDDLRVEEGTNPVEDRQQPRTTWSGRSNICGLSDGVFVGSVVALTPREEPIRPGPGAPASVVTAVTLLVDSPIKGGISAGVEASCDVHGGTWNGLTHLVAGAPRLDLGERYLVVLAQGRKGVDRNYCLAAAWMPSESARPAISEGAALAHGFDAACAKYPDGVGYGDDLEAFATLVYAHLGE